MTRTTSQLKVYTCVNHAVYYPVGAASVVVAENYDAACLLLRDALMQQRLDPDDPRFTLQELDTTKPHAVILRNGDY